MTIERKWAMPSRWTFTIKPIKELLIEEMTEGLWCDPFAGQNSPAQVTNDLNPENPATCHMDALDFLKAQPADHYDGVLFDPPYSPRQVQECYQQIGQKTVADHTRADFWSHCKDEIARVTKPNGKVLCFGWNSMGICKSRGFSMKRILLVPHGGAKNDTICTVEVKN
jgi:tRNA1(Val) A37 N6-methylase TrmN6